MAHYERALLGQLERSNTSKAGAAALEFRRRVVGTFDRCFLDYARVVVLDETLLSLS